MVATNACCRFVGFVLKLRKWELSSEALEGGANHRSHWKWGIESLNALQNKVAFSPSIAVAFSILRIFGLARARSEMKKEEERTWKTASVTVFGLRYHIFTGF